MALIPYFGPIPNIVVHVSIDHFLGGRRRREQMTDEEDNNEEAPPRTRQCVEQEDEECEVFDLTDQESTSSSSRTSSPTLPFIPAVDASSSSESFWWLWRMRRREQMNGEEDNDEEAPSGIRQHVEQEEVFELIHLERSSSPSWSTSFSLDFMPIADANLSNELAYRMRQYEDSDEQTPFYENIQHQNSVAGVRSLFLVFIRIYIISLDLAGILSIHILSIPILFLAI